MGEGRRVRPVKPCGREKVVTRVGRTVKDKYSYITGRHLEQKKRGPGRPGRPKYTVRPNLGRPKYTIHPEEVDERLLQTTAVRNTEKIKMAAKLKEKKAKAKPKEVLNFNSAYFSPNPTGGMAYSVSQNMVEICIRGQVRLLDINEVLPVKCKKSDVKEFPRLPIPSSLPKPSFTIKEDYNRTTAPKRAANYFRYIDKSVEELDQEIEYDMDEEDYAWLDILNERRKENEHSKVPCEVFEQLMDRFEKESYFESQTTGSTYDPLIDEDAVCSICQDGECSNSNVILFCDMCNLAVHQDCYGVPFIPEGQWLCRRCLHSPSKPVDCVLCPSKSGAFKQTDCSRWVHVLCALWVPEVHFSNPVFLEPIDSLNEIPSARWRLTCYICRRREGACIQCVKTNCYTAFHVTCAQQAGLHMKIETYCDEKGASTMKNVAYCDIHTPADSDVTPLISRVNDQTESDVEDGKKVRRKGLLIDKKLQQKLMKRFKCDSSANAPIVSIPYIRQDKMQEILNLVDIDDKAEFFERLKAYWTLKRQARNGVPLLRRLQVTHSRAPIAGKDEKIDKEQLVKYQRLRHDLERARLLVELIRKREKLKKEQLRVAQHVLEMELCPLSYILNRTIDLLFACDTEELFHQPVDIEEVEGYTDEIPQPMDLATMRSKIEAMEYPSFEEFKSDFNLIITNCLKFNKTGSSYYRYAEKMREGSRTILNRCKQTIDNTDIDYNTLQLVQQEKKTLEEQMVDVRLKLEEAKNIVNWSTRTCKLKQLKREIRLIKKRMNEEESMSNPGSVKSEEKSDEVDDKSDKSDEVDKSDKSDEVDKSEVETVKSEESKSCDEGEPPNKRARQAKINEYFGKPKESQDACGDEEDTPAKGTAAASSNTANRRNRSRMHDEIETEISDMLSTNQESLGKKILRFLKRHNISEKKMGSDICMDGGQVGAFLNNKCSLTNTNRELIYMWFVQQRRNREPERLTQEYNDSTPVTSESDSEIELGSAHETSDSEKEADEDVEDPEGDGGDDDKTPVRLRTSSRTPKPRQLDLPEESPYGSRKRKHNNSGSNLSATEDSPYGGRKRKQRNSSISIASSMGDDLSKAVLSDDGDTSINSEQYSKREQDLKYLDLVWAKCAGYPAYPALIIDPSTEQGFTHHGIPIPVPPPDVLVNTKPGTFLVLFFDNRRTWQWLPPRKLLLLGSDTQLDSAKLVECKKAAARKSVTAAFRRATLHRQMVNGEIEESEYFEQSKILEG